MCFSCSYLFLSSTMMFWTFLWCLFQFHYHIPFSLHNQPASLRHSAIFGLCENIADAPLGAQMSWWRWQHCTKQVMIMFLESTNFYSWEEHLAQFQGPVFDLIATSGGLSLGKAMGESLELGQLAAAWDETDTIREKLRSGMNLLESKPSNVDSSISECKCNQDVLTPMLHRFMAAKTQTSWNWRAEVRDRNSVQEEHAEPGGKHHWWQRLGLEEDAALHQAQIFTRWPFNWSLQALGTQNDV